MQKLLCKGCDWRGEKGLCSVSFRSLFSVCLSLTDFLSLSFLCHRFCHYFQSWCIFILSSFFYSCSWKRRWEEREEPGTQSMIMKHSFFTLFSWLTSLMMFMVKISREFHLIGVALHVEYFFSKKRRRILLCYLLISSQNQIKHHLMSHHHHRRLLNDFQSQPLVWFHWKSERW